MAFFEDISKKLTQAGQTAVQKTKEMTDIARLNGLISDEEKKVNNSYYQIGKLYFAMHQNDFENEFAGMVTTICESEAKIKDYRQQIQDIKGMVRCVKCGAEVANTVAFCSSCGNPMAMQTQDIQVNNNLVKCSGCGAMIDKNMRFCTACGKPVEATQQAKPAPVQNQPVVEQANNKCPNCGLQIAEDLAFCTECGTKLK